jgi:hypothetical protein
MLTPRKHLDLDSSVLRIAAIMLRTLKRPGVMEFERLRGVILKRVGEAGEVSFMPALNFLFMLGRVDYHVQNDTIEYRSG